MRAVYDMVDLAAINVGVRQIAFSDQTISPYLPLANVDDLDYRLRRSLQMDQTVPARALDTPAIPIARPGAVEVRGGLPAFAAIELLTETDLQRARRMTGLTVELQPTANNAAINATQTILNSLIVLQGQALFTGAITLSGNGVEQSADFGLTTQQKVAAGTAWTNLAAPVLDNLIAWNDTYLAVAGVRAARMLLSGQYLRLATRNTQVINAVKGSAAGASMVTIDELNALLASNGCAPLQAYDRTFTSETPNQDGTTTVTQTRVSPVNRAVLLPAPGTQLGRTQLGPTEEAAELVTNRVIAQNAVSGLAVTSLISDNPIQRAVKCSAIGMPVIENPRLIMTATLS